MFFITVLIIVIIVVIALLFFNINIKLDIHDNKISIVVSFLKIKLFKRKLVLEREKGEIISLYQFKKQEKILVTTLLDIIYNSRKATDSQKLAQRKVLNYILKRLYIEVLASFSIGTGDAALTANVCSSVKIALGIASGIYTNKRRSFKVNVVPIFSAKQLTADINCIIKVSPANIIIGYLIYKKTKRR